MQKTVNSENWENRVSGFLERVTTHPLLLSTVSQVININSTRKNLTRKALVSLWKELELPNKSDQEKTLYMIHELEFKIKKLEKDLQNGDSSEFKRKLP